MKALHRLALVQQVVQRKQAMVEGALWDGVLKELQEFKQFMTQIAPWKRLKTEEQVRGMNVQLLSQVTWDGKGHLAIPGTNFHTWMTQNFDSENWYTTRGFADLRDRMQDAELTGNQDYPAERALQKGRDLQGWTPGPLVALWEEYQDLVNSFLVRATPERLNYAGFKIRNPDRVFEKTLKRVFAGLDYLVNIFEQRSVSKLLQESLQEVLIRFKYEGDAMSTGLAAAGWYIASKKQIIVTVPLDNNTKLLKNWVAEVCVHEMAHHAETLLHPAAWAEWNSGWSGVEEAKTKKRQAENITVEDRNRFFAMFKASNWDLQKVARKLQGWDRIKYLTWLYRGYPDVDKLFITTPTQVRLNENGKALVEYFKDPEGFVLQDKDELYHIGMLYVENEETRVPRQIAWLEARFLKQLGVFREGDSPRLDPKVVEEIRQTDNSVDEALKALEAPTSYAKTNPQEDFADTFVAYMGNPGALSAKAKYRLQRTLWLSGFYGKPIARLAKRIV
jgi:hypothetical protein